jgi:hypothetical protein
MTTNRAYHMTVLHSALVFIEENLPSYFDSKDKNNPLKENFTPFFNANDITLSPKSIGPTSNYLSAVGNNSFKRDLPSYDVSMREPVAVAQDEELLF